MSKSVTKRKYFTYVTVADDHEGAEALLYRLNQGLIIASAMATEHAVHYVLIESSYLNQQNQPQNPTE